MNKLFFLGLGACLSGCSLLGLTDGLKQQSCVGEELDFCRELNEISPTGDDCMTWQCDQGEGVCVPKPRDEDNDTFADAECVPEDPSRDCNDADDTLVGLDAPERCDGIDNNCDGVVDEGAYEEPALHRVIPSGLAEANPDYVAYSITPTLESWVIVPDADNVHIQGAFLLPIGELESKLTDESNNYIAGRRGTGIAIASIGSTDIVARVNESPQLVLGWISGQRFHEGSNDVHDDSGLIPLPDGCVGASLPSLAPAGDERVLVGFVCRSEIPEGCDEEPADVYVTTGRFRNNNELTVASAAPLRVGRTRDRSPIAIIGAEASFGWILGYINADTGALELHRVFLSNATTGAVMINPLFTRAAGEGEVLSEPSFALGAANITAQTRQIAVSMKTACFVDEPLVAQAFEVDFGDVTFEEVSGEHSQAVSRAPRRPIMVWEDQEGWLLSWSELDRIVAQRLDATLAPIGDAWNMFPLAAADDGTSFNHGLAGRSVLDAQARPRFELFSYVSDEDIGVRGLWQLNAGCGLTEEE